MTSGRLHYCVRPEIRSACIMKSRGTAGLLDTDSRSRRKVVLVLFESFYPALLHMCEGGDVGPYCGERTLSLPNWLGEPMFGRL